MKNSLKVSAVLVLFLAFLSACTTATYGEKLSPVSGQKDQYTLVVSTGGFSGVDAATKRLEEKEIPEFLKENPQYSSYKIISSQFRLVPSGVTFVVQFFPGG